MSFDSTANNLIRIPVAAAHTSGSSSLVLGVSGTAFPAAPFRVTAITGASYGTTAESLTIYSVTAVATNSPQAGQCTLTVAAIEGTTDQNYGTSDFAEMRITAGTISDLNTAVAALQAGAPGGLVFTASGTLTAAQVPSSAVWLVVECVGGGGGGGGGASVASGSAGGGGGGGSGGTMQRARLKIGDLAFPISIAVGPGGAGGTGGPSTGGIGGNGGNGGSTTFGSYVVAPGGLHGNPGTTAAGGNGGIQLNAQFPSFGAGAGGFGAAGGASGTATGAGGGGGGGGVSTTPAAFAGGSGAGTYGCAQVGSTAGGAIGTAGGNGTTAGLANSPSPGGGGAGGGSSITAAGGNGGNGGTFGGGGGGGGAALIGFAGGTGGAGAPGLCVVAWD